MLGKCIGPVQRFSRLLVAQQEGSRSRSLGRTRDLAEAQISANRVTKPQFICYNAKKAAESMCTAMPTAPTELELNPFFTATNHAPKTAEKLHVREYGTGESTVLMLHGLSQTGESWKSLLEHMNDRKFRYVCPDLLGHERDVTDRLGGVGTAKSHAPFRLVGVGLGAILALELASRMPSRVTSLHLISLPYYESEVEASEDLLSHLVHPIGQFKFLSRVSSALISYNDDIMKPLIDISRVVATPRSPESTTNLPEHIHAVCSTIDECMVKHRIHDAADRIERSRLLRMDLIQGALDTPKHNQMADRFYSEHVNSSSIFYLDGAASDIPRSNPEELGLLLTRDYLSNKQ